MVELKILNSIAIIYNSSFKYVNDVKSYKTTESKI